MKDKKSINQSHVKILEEPNAEIILNCCIYDVDNNSIIAGKVINICDRKPISQACIKFTDKNYNPLCHCFTDEEGYFYINQYFLDTIRIIVSKKGYKTYSSCTYYITDPQLKNIIIKLTPRCKGERIITGFVSDCDYKPAENVHVILKKEEDNCIYSTYTNENGIFIVDDVDHGFYKITFCSHMYYKYSYNIIFDNGIILFLGETRIKKKELKGTLNGIITDEHGKPINEAVVVLFNSKNNTPLQFTSTNENGVYLFYDLDIGRYYIVSNKSIAKEKITMESSISFNDNIEDDYYDY